MRVQRTDNALMARLSLEMAVSGRNHETSVLGPHGIPGGEGSTAPMKGDAAGSLHGDRLDRLHAVVWEFDLATDCFSFVSAGSALLLGYPPTIWGFAGEFWRHVVHPADLERVLDEWRIAKIASGSIAIVHRVVTADGQVKHVQNQVTRGVTADRLVGLLVEVAESIPDGGAPGDRRARSLLLASPLGRFRASVSGELLEVNSALARLLGYRSSAEAVGLRIGEDLATSQAEGQRVVQALACGQAQERLETTWRRHDGRSIVVHINSRPHVERSGGGSFIDGIVVDVTQESAHARQLQDSRQLEVVGRLAGGVAHDFNNLLTVIAGYAALLTERLAEDGAPRAYAEGIVRAAARASTLTQQLLAFSRRQVLDAKVVQLNAVITELDSMLRRLLGEPIELVTRLDPQLELVKVDPIQIEQVLVNLVLNARDAIRAQGQITISTRNIELETGDDWIDFGLAPGRYVEVAVSDTGQGMDEETLVHVFEPFYTTKPSGTGTGLGLSMVYGIVRQSGGHIRAASAPGRGTTITFTLPIADPAQAPVSTFTDLRSAHGSETILVVEDEEAVRSLISQVLRERGYQVLEASDGADALQLASGFASPIHLLLTDLVMPRIGGRELAGRLCPLRPDIRVLYVSGYSDQVLFGAADLGPEAAFMQKPFSPDTLARKVRELLDRRG